MRTFVLALGLAACGGGSDAPADAPTAVDVPGDAMPREVVMENIPLGVNETIEAILEGGPGDYAIITMSAGGSLIDWNLHGHANGATQVVKEELKVASVDYVFMPTAQAEWYLLIRNKGATGVTVQVKLQLFGALSWRGLL